MWNSSQFNANCYRISKLRKVFGVTGKAIVKINSYPIINELYFFVLGSMDSHLSFSLTLSLFFGLVLLLDREIMLITPIIKHTPHSPRPPTADPIPRPGPLGHPRPYVPTPTPPPPSPRRNNFQRFKLFVISLFKIVLRLFISVAVVMLVKSLFIC